MLLLKTKSDTKLWHVKVCNEIKLFKVMSLLILNQPYPSKYYTCDGVICSLKGVEHVKRAALF